MKRILFFKETSEVLQLMKASGLTLGAAESCTGGLFSQIVTSIPGASEVFCGAVVAYSNQVKQEMLGVSAKDLRDCGAVSEEVACAMASGARRALKVDLAVSATGVAGPSGGTAEKPVGTVWIGIASDQGTRAVRLVLAGDREAIRQGTVRCLLEELSGVLGSRSVK